MVEQRQQVPRVHLGPDAVGEPSSDFGLSPKPRRSGTIRSKWSARRTITEFPRQPELGPAVEQHDWWPVLASAGVVEFGAVRLERVVPDGPGHLDPVPPLAE